MKRIIISTLLLLGVFGGALAHSYYVSSITRDVTFHLEEAESYVTWESWSDAEEQVKTAQQLWEDQSSYLHNFLQHRDVDNIDLTFQEAAEYLRCRKTGEFSAVTARLIKQLELLAGAEQLTLQNVF